MITKAELIERLRDFDPDDEIIIINCAAASGETRRCLAPEDVFRAKMDVFGALRFIGEREAIGLPDVIVIECTYATPSEDYAARCVRRAR